MASWLSSDLSRVPMLSTMFIAGGINSLKNSDYLARRSEPVTKKLLPLAKSATSSLPISLDEKRLVQFNGALQVVGGAMLATGKSPRLVSLGLVASLVPTTFGGHRFWEETDPQARANQQTHFLKNVSMAGGLLLASVDTEGKPSLAWRARRQASRARKRAGELTPG